jgi:membrane protease YdiL (CAAX protease family)
MNKTGGIILFILLFSFAAELVISLAYMITIVLPSLPDTHEMTREALNEIIRTELRNMLSNPHITSVFLLASPFVIYLTAIAGKALAQLKLTPLFSKPNRLEAPPIAVVAVLSLGIAWLSSYLGYLIDYLLSVFGFEAVFPSTILHMPLGQTFPMIAFIAAICIGAPLFEELLFRGVILNVLKPYGNSFAVVISALFFALIHGNLYQGTMAFCLGLVLGIVTLRTQSLWPAIFIHAIINTTSVIQEYLNLTLATNLKDIVIGSIDIIIILLTVLFVIAYWAKLKSFVSILKHDSPEPSPYWQHRWTWFWTSPCMLIALIIWILLFLGGGITVR